MQVTSTDLATTRIYYKIFWKIYIYIYIYLNVVVFIFYNIQQRVIYQIQVREPWIYCSSSHTQRHIKKIRASHFELQDEYVPIPYFSFLYDKDRASVAVFQAAGTPLIGRHGFWWTHLAAMQSMQKIVLRSRVFPCKIPVRNSSPHRFIRQRWEIYLPQQWLFLCLWDIDLGVWALHQRWSG
jgi:hypothetical protein